MAFGNWGSVRGKDAIFSVLRGLIKLLRVFGRFA